MADTLIRFPVIIESDPERSGVYKAYAPDFEETSAEAMTMDEALDMVTHLITYQVGMLMVKEEDYKIPVPSSLERFSGRLRGNGRCFGWADINPFAIKMQIETARANALQAQELQYMQRQSQKQAASSISNAVLFGSWFGSWLGGRMGR